MVGASPVGEVAVPYIRVPIGWSNLQFGPNLQMP